MTERLPKMAPPVQETVTSAGELRLRHNLQSLIGDAQRVKGALTMGTGGETRLMEGVQNFAEATPLLGRLIEILETLPRNANLVQSLRQLLIAEGNRLLGDIDRLLQQERLFTPSETALLLWDGRSPLSRAIYGVADQEELEYYLRAQRSRLEYLVNQYAEPVLKFLESQQRYATEGFYLAPKWRGIQQELDKYQRKQPENSIARLEKFILFDLDKIQLGNCFTDLEQSRPHSPQDYFTRQFFALQRGVFGQCVALGNRLALDVGVHRRVGDGNTLWCSTPLGDLVDMLELHDGLDATCPKHVGRATRPLRVTDVAQAGRLVHRPSVDHHLATNADPTEARQRRDQEHRLA